MGSREPPGGIEPLLEPNAHPASPHPASRAHQEALFSDGTPAAVFFVGDLDSEHECLIQAGVRYPAGAHPHRLRLPDHARRHLREPDRPYTKSKSQQPTPPPADGRRKAAEHKRARQRQHRTAETLPGRTSAETARNPIRPALCCLIRHQTWHQTWHQSQLTSHDLRAPYMAQPCVFLPQSTLVGWAHNPEVAGLA